MAVWVDFCNETNMCGTHVCKDRNGDLVQPIPGKRAAAMEVPEALSPSTSTPSAQAQVGSGDDGLSVRAAAAISASGFTQNIWTNVPNAAEDPFLGKLPSGQQQGIFLAFNPPTADGYKMIISRWCAAFLLALDEVVNSLQ